METNHFDPNGTGQDNGNYFGLPFTPEESRLVLLSVPWDVTSSYGEGSAYAPDAIIGASTQLDLYEPAAPGVWQRGIGTIGIDYRIQESSVLLREEARKVMKHLENGKNPDDDYVTRRVALINEKSAGLNDKVYDESLRWLECGKIVGLVGGDHSTPLGLIHALAKREGAVSILHIDAHADLRPAYQGFTYSHASVMYNVATSVPGIERLVQVGVRDMCDCEAEMAQGNPNIDMYTDFELSSNEFRGMTWDAQCEKIVGGLGQNVYVSFDIDGLSPENSPHTGTPVPGGLTFNKAVWLINKIAETGRRIVGFDLVEVAPEVGREWDANVGARMLYKLCCLTLKTDK
ncbi:agmatinase family protein [Alistipes sp. OttesenSCG-928-B03]|nr:agmatinase family protein [Alistipes sp. OttesenSCG-928-B03]